MPNAPVRHTAPKPSDKVTAPNPSAPAVEPYYKAVSGKYRAAKHITALLLVVFLLFSFAFMRDDITLENLRYLLKFISFTNTETSITATKINYPSGEPNRLELFIGDLCTLSPEGYALYDARGNQIMAEDIKYVSPVLKISSRFALCYDLDANAFTVLNTFTKLYEGTSEYPITDGTIANDGSFAIASSSREYRTAITLYNSDFTPITRILKNDHLMGIELLPDASQIAVMTAGAENGRFHTKIELIAPGSDTPDASCTLDGLGYSLYFTERGLCVVTDEGISFLDNDLKEITAYKHSAQLAMSHFSEKYLTVIYSSAVIGNNYHAFIYDVNGRLVYDKALEGKLIAVDSDDSGEYIFILTGTTLTRVNLINKKIGTMEVTSEAIDILVPTADSVLVALKNYALTYDLNSLEEHYFDRISGNDTGTSDTMNPTNTTADTQTATDDDTAKDTTAEQNEGETQ